MGKIQKIKIKKIPPKLEVSKWWEQVVAESHQTGWGPDLYDTDLTDHCSCLSDGRNWVFFTELQCPGTKETNLSLPVPNSHRNGLFRSKKEVMQTALLTALPTDPKLLCCVTRVSLPLREEKPLSSLHSSWGPSRLPGLAPPFRINRWKGTSGSL